MREVTTLSHLAAKRHCDNILHIPRRMNQKLLVISFTNALKEQHLNHRSSLPLSHHFPPIFGLFPFRHSFRLSFGKSLFQIISTCSFAGTLALPPSGTSPDPSYATCPISTVAVRPPCKRLPAALPTTPPPPNQPGDDSRPIQF